MEGIRRALVLCLVLIAGTAIEQAPSVGPHSSLVFPFTEEEYKKGIVTLKNKKAAGIDDVLVEQLKYLGPRAHIWLHSMLNVCFTENRIHGGNRKSLQY